MLDLCDQIAMENSTCNRGPLLPDGTHGVGCILLCEGHNPIYTSNKSLPGLLTCDDTDHDMEYNHCQATSHSEQEAICLAAKYGYKTEGATIYINCYPCWKCFQSIVLAGIKNIFYKNFYLNNGERDRVAEAIELLKGTENEITLINIKD